MTNRTAVTENDDFADPQKRPRYVGIPTFMRTPYVEDPAAAGVDIGLIGVPFDGGVTNRTGTRHGPREVRNQSSLIRKVNQATGIAPFDLCRVADLGDAWVRSPFHLEDALAEIEAHFRRVLDAGVMPLACGGDHSISLPILRALARDRGPVGMVHIDAHGDTGPKGYLGSDYHHGAPFSRAVEEGLLDPRRTIQIGVRGSVASLDVAHTGRELGMRVVPIEEFHEMGVKAAVAEARRVVGDDGPTYVSFDIDSLDPGFAPGTGTPEIGGLTPLEAQLLVRGLRGLNLVGADMVEVSPPFDPSGVTALIGANMMFELLCVLADAVAARRRT